VISKDIMEMSMGLYDYAVLARLAAREKARSAEDIARDRGWRIEWSEPTEYSWRVVVVDGRGVELAREENIKPRWWEQTGAGERRLAEMEVRAVNSAIEGAG
jgi:hypothetical protein